MDKFKKLIVILLFTTLVSSVFTLLFKSPTPVKSLTNTVVINEVAWAGTEASDADDWIELFNATGSDVDLTGWSLNATDGVPAIALNGTIPANGFFLLERTDDTTIKDITANQFFTGALGNDGESLELRNTSSELVDSANADGGAWPAGSSSPAKTMERINPLLADSDDNWATNDGATINGTDSADGTILGTPKAANSVLNLSITPTEGVTPTQEPTPIPTTEPTAEPTVVPTEEPTPIPTEEPTPIPTAEPTAEPTAIPTGEPSPTLTPVPSPQPTPQGMVIGVLGFGTNRTTCRLSFRLASFGFLRFFLPRISCS